MVPLLERKLSLSILNISILLKTNYNKQRAINGYKAVIPYGLLEERGTDVCTDNNISIFYIITYHKKPVISSHSVTPLCRFLVLITFDVICDLFLKQT